MTAHVNTLTAAMIDGRGHGPQGSAEIRNRDELDCRLKQSFAEGVSGPIAFAHHFGRSSIWGSRLRR